MGSNISVDKNSSTTEVITNIMNETYNEFKTNMSQKVKLITEQTTKVNNTQQINISNSKLKDVKIKQNALIDVCQKISSDMQSYLNTLSTMISKDEAQQTIQDELDKAAQSASDSFQLAVNSSTTDQNTKQKLESAIRTVNSIVNDINLQFESYVKNGTEMNLEQIINIVDSELENIDITQEQSITQSQEQATTQTTNTQQEQTTESNTKTDNTTKKDTSIKTDQKMTNKGLIAVAIVVLIVAIIVFYFYIQYQKKKTTGGMVGMGRRYQQMKDSFDEYWKQLKL